MTDWRDLAACKGQTNVMFTPADSGRQDRWARARAVCDKCPVADVCLAAALIEEHGLPSYLRFGLRGGQAPSGRLRIGTHRRELEARLAVELAAWPGRAEDHGKKTCEADRCDKRFRSHPKGPHRRFCSRRCQRNTQERRRRRDPVWRAKQIARRRAAYQRDREYETARQRRYDRAKAEQTRQAAA